MTRRELREALIRIKAEIAAIERALDDRQTPPPTKAPRPQPKPRPTPTRRVSQTSQTWRDRSPKPTPQAVAQQRWRDVQAAAGGSCGACSLPIDACICVVQQRAFARSVRRTA